MSLIVQKYGGTSVANADRLRNVARRVCRTKAMGHDVVVVASAAAGTTDKLIAMAHEISNDPHGREYDMLVSTGEQISVALLAMAIQELGCPSVSMTGFQVGILTDSAHTKARIIDISTEKVLEELHKGQIVVIAGFQGVDITGNITTLGRGGSDTSAVAVAAALKAHRCEIYTDVDGVYTADPRIVPSARKLNTIRADEMLELAGLGAKVLQLRSVEFASKYNVPLEVLTSFSDEPGTLIVQETQNMEEIVVTGVALVKNQARVNIFNVPDRPGVAARIFGAIAKKNVDVDMIVQAKNREGEPDMSFTVSKLELKKTEQAVNEAIKGLGSSGMTIEEGFAKVSAVGIGMRGHPGVAAQMFEALAANKINIEMISTSEIKISCLVKEDQGEQAVRAVHESFQLGEPSGAATSA
ncbi:MAG: aspartate kinase [bacterium]|nr:aspartate kinase [bacterium]